MDVLAVVPALSPLSERPLAGETLTAHAVQQARGARHVMRTAVVSSNPACLRHAAAEGIDIVAPPATGTLPAVLGAALEAMAQDGFAPSVAVLLDPSFALRTSACIDDALELLLRCGADSLVAVRPVPGPFWVQDEGEAAVPVDPTPAQRRYVQSGALTAVRVGVFEQSGEIPCGRIVLFEVPALCAVEAEEGASWLATECVHRIANAARATSLLRRVRLLAFDFDGVMTDNRVLVLEDGREAVACSRGDGMGLEMLRKSGLPLVVISKEQNPVVAARCRKLAIPCAQGIEDKLTVLRDLAAEHRLSLDQIGYFGNDVNDLACMHAAGVAIAPADAHVEALRAADIVTAAAGGFGAVREICDLLLAIRAEQASVATT